MRRPPTHMTRTDWAIAVAMAFPFAMFFLIVAVILVFG
jgi:hypothetical protein